MRGYLNRLVRGVGAPVLFGAVAVSLGTVAYILFCPGISPAVRGLTAQVSNAGTAVVQVAVRLDDPDSGPLLGTLDVPGTGGHYAYTTATTTLSGIPRGAGTHKVYLVFDGPAAVHTFNFTG